MNPQQIRFNISTNQEHEPLIRQCLKVLEVNGWEEAWYKVKPRGSHGDLVDLVIGYVEGEGV